MERGVGEPVRGVVWVVEEVGVHADDAGAEGGVCGVDCAAEAL